MLTSDRANPVHDRIPERFRGASLDDLTPTVRAGIEHAMQTGLGVVLHGPTGRGKTYALAAMCKATLTALNAKRRESGAGPLYADRWIGWFEQLEDVMRARNLRGPDANRFDPAVWAARVPEMLFIDDVGAEISPLMTEVGAEKFALLINERDQSKRLTSFTTNFTPAEIEKRYGARTMSRLYSSCTWIELTGPDRRLTARAS